MLPDIEKNERGMSADDVLETIKMLAKSQGFYQRLLSAYEDMEEENKELFRKQMEAQRFKEPIDVVMYFET